METETEPAPSAPAPAPQRTPSFLERVAKHKKQEEEAAALDEAIRGVNKPAGARAALVRCRFFLFLFLSLFLLSA